MGEVDQLPATAPVDPVQAYRDAVAYAGMLRQSALGSAGDAVCAGRRPGDLWRGAQEADFDYYTALAHSALGLQIRWSQRQQKRQLALHHNGTGRRRA
jgi:hypothetical protein